MGRPPKRGFVAEDTSPDEMPQVEPRGLGDAGAFTVSAAFELSMAVSRLEERISSLSSKIDALTATVEKSHTKMDASIEKASGKLSDEQGKSNDRIRKLEDKALLILGGIAVALVLIPACAGVVWWALGNQITALLLNPPA